MCVIMCKPVLLTSNVGNVINYVAVRWVARTWTNRYLNTVHQDVTNVIMFTRVHYRDHSVDKNVNACSHAFMFEARVGLEARASRI